MTAAPVFLVLLGVFVAPSGGRLLGGGRGTSARASAGSATSTPPPTDSGREECAVCYEGFHVGRPAFALHCHSAHRFHKACLETLVKRDRLNRLKSKCPLCRRPLDDEALEQLGVVDPKMHHQKREWLEKVIMQGLDLKHAPDSLRADRRVVLKAVQENGRALVYALGGWSADREIVETAVVNGGRLDWASPELQADPELQAAERNYWLEQISAGGSLQLASPSLRTSPALQAAEKDYWLQAVGELGRSLCDAPPRLRADSDVVLRAVGRGRDSYALRCAQGGLDADPRLVLAAVRRNSDALKHAAISLRADPAFVLEAVQANACALEHALGGLKADRKVVLKAVRANGLALEHARGGLNADRQVVLAAVGQNGDALRYAAKNCTADPEVVLEAIRENWEAAYHAAAELRDSHAFVFQAVRNGFPLAQVEPQLRKDPEWQAAEKEYWIRRVRHDGDDLRHAPPRLQGARDVVLEALGQQSKIWQTAGAKGRHAILENFAGTALQYASQGLRDEAAFAKVAVRTYGLALRDLPPKLQRHTGVVEEALRSVPEAQRFAGRSVTGDDN